MFGELPFFPKTWAVFISIPWKKISRLQVISNLNNPLRIELGFSCCIIKWTVMGCIFRNRKLNNAQKSNFTLRSTNALQFKGIRTATELI